MGILTNIFVRRFKLMVAPFLLSKADYWGYIQTKQAFLAANKSIVRIQLLMGIFFSWVVVFAFFNTVLSETSRYVLATALSLVSIAWYLMTVHKKWWHGLTILLTLLFVALAASLVYQSGFVFKTYGPAYILIVYLVLGHLVMLARVKSLADATR